MKIPFRLLPASWGLKGKTKLIAEAEYTLQGYELDVALAKINADGNEDILAKSMIQVELNHNKLDQYEADRRLAKLSIDPADEKALDAKLLEVDFIHKKISQIEYDRKQADILEQPYMAMPKISWDPADPSKTYFELDYNKHFVQFLEANGYVGAEEDIINRWLNDVCSSVLDEMVPNEPEFVRTVRTVRRNDGKTEHS